MQQIIENWSQLGGTVLAVHPHPTNADFSVVRVAVDSAAPVQGFAHLLDEAKGKEIDVNVKTEKIKARVLAPGARVEFRARKSKPTIVFAHPESF